MESVNAVSEGKGRRHHRGGFWNWPRDVNEQGLAETAEKCQAHGVQVRTTRVDVAQRQAVHAWADDVARDLGAVHLIINNAGVAVGATIEDTGYEALPTSSPPSSATSGASSSAPTPSSSTSCSA